METSAQHAEKTPAPHKMHWHVAFTHFPISAFLGSFLFMTLHIIGGNACYSLAAYVSLIAGATVIIPTTLTGWFAWKKSFHGARVPLFIIKLRVSIAMIIISIGLVLYQTAFPIGRLDIWHFYGHFLYFVGIVLLLLGAAVEGYYGGRLSHR